MKVMLRPVPGYNDLEVSPDGSVVVFNGKYKKPYLVRKRGSNAYWTTRIGKIKVQVHVLVYLAYVNKEKRKNIIFKDGDSLNMNYKNLGPDPLPDFLKGEMHLVPGSDDVMVNRHGTIVTQFGVMLNVTRILSNNPNYRKGYDQVFIIDEKRKVQQYVHRLVAEAFLEKPTPFHKYVLHLNGDTLDNRLENLKWATKEEKDGQGYKFADKTKKADSVIPLCERQSIIHRLREGETLKRIAADYGISDMTVHRFKKKFVV